MNKHGMTLIELLGVIVVLSILMGLVVISMSSVFTNSQTGILKNYEKSMKSGAINYFADNLDKLPNENSYKKIFLDTLIEEKYLDSLKGVNDANCKHISDDSYVLVKRDNDINNNYNLEYEVCLICLDDTNIVSYTSIDNCDK